MHRLALLMVALAGCARPEASTADGDASEIYRRLVIDRLPEIVAAFDGAEKDRAAVAEAQRIERGRYPERMVRGADPYDGKPLKYRRLEMAGWESFVVYAGECSVDWDRFRWDPEAPASVKGSAWWLWRKR